MNTVGCIFCEKTGTLGNVNQHLRNFFDSSRTGRTSRGASHHHLDLIQMLYHTTATPQDSFIRGTSASRIAVLTAFSSRLTKHLRSDAEVAQWRRRDFYPRRATWWERQLATVQAMYDAAGRMPALLAAHVENVVESSVAESLLTADDDEEDPPPRAKHSQVVHADASAAPKAEMNLQYSGSQIGAGNAMDNVLRTWTRGGHARAAAPVNPASSARYVTISDDEDDAPPPTKDDMAPLLTLQVRGLTGRVATLPIAYGTTLARALAMAMALAPRFVREAGARVAFEGDEGTEWGGEWPEWRWEDVMRGAETKRVTVVLRLVLVE